MTLSQGKNSEGVEPFADILVDSLDQPGGKSVDNKSCMRGRLPQILVSLTNPNC